MSQQDINIRAMFRNNLITMAVTALLVVFIAVPAVAKAVTPTTDTNINKLVEELVSARVRIALNNGDAGSLNNASQLGSCVQTDGVEGLGSNGRTVTSSNGSTASNTTSTYHDNRLFSVDNPNLISFGHLADISTGDTDVTVNGDAAVTDNVPETDVIPVDSLPTL